MKFTRIALAGLLAGSALWHVAPAHAQYTATLPTTCRADGSQCVASTPVTNPDGTPIAAAPTGTAGTPNSNVQTVQGITNGTPQNTISRGGTSMATGQISVTTTATLIAAARTNRQRITVSVTTAVACAFGNTGVTTATGFPLTATAGASYTIDTSAALYGVCASAATVGYMETF